MPRRPSVALAVLLAGFALAVRPALAHELRPAYLDLRQTVRGEYDVLWKTPMRGDTRLDLAPEFSGDTVALTPVTTHVSRGAAVQEWRFRAPALRGQRLRIRGLDATLTDALVRIEFSDGTTWTQRLTARTAEATIPARPSQLTVVRLYLELGVTHILTGLDHLLFVLALLLIARDPWRLVKTVTAFTVAHSVTLGLATLGVVHVPQPPVEAAIALSIVFVAAEIVRSRRGAVGVAMRAPWIVALGFGLLHGLGFAGALADVGLPHGDIPLALLCFNAGVEIGQLVFVAAVLAAIATARRGRWRLPASAELIPAYAIGIVAMFWVIERVAAF